MARDNIIQSKASGFSREENDNEESADSQRANLPPNAFRGHLPPPFYSAKEENFYRRQYPSEARFPGLANEDIANYGRGGYYGSTYGQEMFNRERQTGQNARTPYRDTYRHLGDRRWSDD